MQIVVAQLNVTVGDLSGNATKIMRILEDHEDADLVVFPELAITGYPPQDLVFNTQFIQENKDMLSTIAHDSPTSAVIGFIDSTHNNLYNAAALIKNNTVYGIQHKILLPNYDVFDERRYFTPGKTQKLFTLHGKTVGIEICEDLWEQNYEHNPTSCLIDMGADIIINISASPFCVGKEKERLTLARSFDLPFFIYCNLIGGQDELIFDGNSFALKDGNLIWMGHAFQEDIGVLHTQTSDTIHPVHLSERASLFTALTLGLKDYCRKTHFSQVVFGLSGGIDSSLVACIAAEALGTQNVTALFMPSQYTSSHSREDAHTLAHNLGIDILTVPIDDIFSIYTSVLHPVFSDRSEDSTEENIQARIRGNILMAYSNKFSHLVLATGNKTELALGYCTLYGDMSGGLAVIGDVSKSRVYELARYYNELKGQSVIPERVLTRSPSAELKEGQVDPFDYAIVSPLVDSIIEERMSPSQLIASGYSSQLVEDIMRRIQRNEYKRRQAAPVLKVTKKAFGGGRRFPIANHYW
ncbi:MAG: NAD+ synthase [Theionarchaea archaeon]|nr:NAD+ synthase [Theionarchaea archaeon]